MSRRQWVLVATILASSMTFIDGTVVNVALPALQSALGASITDVQWVVEAYALFLGALILVGGAIGDQFGRRRVFLGGVVLFTAASAGCGLAASIDVLIVFRAVQGIGAAFLVPGSLAIISATYDDASRGRAIGTWSGFSAITTAAGPVAGGWLIEHVSWRAVFFINVPLAAVVLLLARCIDESRDPDRSPQIDWTGASLTVTALGGVVLALIEWPPLGFTHPLVIGSMTAGVAAFAMLLRTERRARNPMLPLVTFESRTFTLANLLTLLVYAALGIAFFLVPLNLIEAQGYTATEAGAALLPFPIIMFALSRWSGGLVARVGSRLPLAAGPVVAAAGFALFARPEIGGSYWTTFFPPAVVLGLGMAITVAPLTTTVMGAVASRHAGVASGINNAVSRVAGLLAIAVLGIVLTHAFRTDVTGRLDRLGLSRANRVAVDGQLDRMAAANIPASLEPGTRAAARDAIDRAFVHAFRIVLLTAAVVALGGAACGAAIRPESG
jgi:EmrB/QacA subfamily drug resistance transporter